MKKILIFIAALFVFVGSVKAENVTLVKDVYDNTYVYYYDRSMGKTRYLHASKYLFGNIPAYCIELGKDIASFDYTMTNSFNGINISKEDLEYIKLLSYYGYNYPGHDTDRYYMATQGLIWKRLAKTSIKFTIGFNPDTFYNLTDEETAINVLVNRHNIRPSFDNANIDVIRGNETVLEDENEVLYLYYSDDDNVVIDGNKLIIKKDFDKDNIVLKRHNYTNKEFFLYTSGNSQKMMSSGGITNSTSNLNINLISGSIEIEKLDKETLSINPQGEASLNGAIYGLYDFGNNLLDTFVIGSKNKIENLPLGRYYIMEITPGEGYLLDDKIYVVQLDRDNLDIKRTVYDEVIKRKVEIFKVYASNETGFMVGEENIQFDIFDKDNNLVTSITTDSDGYASTYLVYGTYTVKQVNSTPGYYKIDNFKVTIDREDDRPIFKLISDSKITGKVRVIKKDYDTNDNIINGKARFRIFDVNNKKYVSFKVSYPREEVIDTFDIDSNGTFMTPDVLEPGKYILYEVDTDMDGYLYNKEGISFTIGEDSDMIKENDDMVLELYFYNKRVKGTLNITKYGENIKYNDDKYYYNNDILLNDVVFYLYAKEDIYENGKLIYSKDDKVNECTTNDGKCKIENIPLGNYYLKEISSSEGNVLDNTEYNISFSYKDQYTENIVYNLEVKNHLPKSKVVINKYETGTKNGISGTLIEIRNINNEIIYKGYTDKNGKIILDDMLYGKYYVSEVEASTGYRLVQDKIYFEVGDKDIDIDIYNERIKVPNTGISFDIKDIFVIVCFISSLGGILLKYKNKYIVIVGLFVIITSILYFGLKIYNHYNDIKINDKAVEAVLNKKIDSLDNLKYRYKAVLEIPSIKLKRGILDIDNKYNKAKYNIELIKEKDDIIVLASHNGNNYNSYFGNLKNISLGDTINYYYDGKIYKYIYTDSYDIKKDGYADIYRKKGNKCIVLVTCKDGRNDGQTVFIGYLDEILEY